MSASTLPSQQPSGADPLSPDAGQLPAVARAGPAGPGDVGELCEQFRAVCESAVDPLEIASALEFEGHSDRTAEQRYGVLNIFALAEEMYRRVPRRPAEPAPAADPWAGSRLRPALHGVLYGLPTACFPAAAGLLAGPGVPAMLMVALFSSWAMSQALAYLGYLRLSRAEPGGAARLLRAGLAAGMAAVLLALAVAAPAVHAGTAALIVGAGLGGYMLGASVLMVLRAERLLLIVLAPGVLGSLAYLALGRPAQLSHLAWAMLASTPLLALGLAIARSSRDARRAGRAGRLLQTAELRGALPSAGFGLIAAGLLVFPIAAGSTGHRGASGGALFGSLPLALSMGAAEWALIWFRRRARRSLGSTRTQRAFGTRARLALLAALLQYLICAAVLTAAVITIAAWGRLIHPHPADLPQAAAYLALGGSLFLTLLLQAFGTRTFPVLACAAALVTEVVTRDLGVAGQIVACSALLIVLTWHAAVVLGRAVRHG